VHRRCVSEKETNQGEPEARCQAAAEERHLEAERHHDAGDDEQPACSFADQPRGPRRLGEAARHSPHDRAEDPSAVEREARDQVEDADHDVHRAEPDERGRDRTKIGEHDLRRFDVDDAQIDRDRRHYDHQDAEADARNGSDDRHEELGAGRRGLFLDVRDTAEQVQRDVTYRDAVEAGDRCVRELMEQHRREEHERGGDGDGDARPERPVGMPAGEKRRQAPRHEDEDEQPARIDAKVDAEDAA
jgi:hypothetical protein